MPRELHICVSVLVLIAAPSSFCDVVRLLLQSCYREDLFSSLELQSQNRVSHRAVVACYIRMGC